jgi:PhzF family phenazine biosynthesis protein
MQIPVYQIDAFTDHVFGGNPAAVCPLEKWLDDETLQNIAAENNLAETAFFVPQGDEFHIRWFTPTVEVTLCGHATLATSWVLFNRLGYSRESITFRSLSGPLVVKKIDNKISMNFPAWKPESIDIPQALTEAFGKKPNEVLMTEDCLVVFDSEDDVLGFEPDQIKLLEIDALCIIATAKGDTADFVSRVFVPRGGIPEDPVTGRSFSSLIPYWSKVLGKTSMKAIQLSKRQGHIDCELEGERINIAGDGVLFLEGTISI